MISLPKEGGVIDLAPDYHVEVVPGDCLIVRAGASLGKAAAGFEHPNILKRADTVHWFKRQLPQGGKRWRSRAGRDFYFVIPKEFIAISEEPGYSYVKAQINGVQVTLNISGGTQNGWTDWISQTVSISINHPIRDLLKFAAVALSLEEAARRGIVPEVEPLEEGDRRIFDQAAAKVKLAGKIREGGKIVLGEGYSHGDEKELVVESVVPRRRLIIAKGALGRVRVGYAQIDWKATLEVSR
jgi:hypothetical protein